MTDEYSVASWLKTHATAEQFDSFFHFAVTEIKDEELKILFVKELGASWDFWARPDQYPPAATKTGTPWRTWMIRSGRGAGKTRTGAEWVHIKAREMPGCRIALIGNTAADCRDVMVGGDSGIVATARDDFRPSYNPSTRSVVWPNGTSALTFSGDAPDQLRGPQFHAAWIDELAKMRYHKAMWDNLQMGLRLGAFPQCLVTTTPRPLPLLKKIIASPSTVETRVSTFANKANLPDSFFEALKEQYEGTRIAAQEIYGEIVEDIEGALWTRDAIERNYYDGDLPEFVRIVVGVDPSGFDGETGDSQGIVVAGLGVDKIYYVLDDRTCRLKPEGWGLEVVKAYRDWLANTVVAEQNYGGGMCRSTVHQVDNNVPVKMVTATRGKAVRAEGVSVLYDQNRVRHVRAFGKLEDQMCQMTTQGFQGAGSPDRLDALVWALTELTGGVRAPTLTVI